ncbi:oligosaccharide flippase family protein [Methanobacterium paludis]|uniref:oligosaccharide flippase family protein n=1 Tax=Methanobacterium paludis (strain DSM 25820 / JCM 18151 / SWAN1) TaxID=868131 RepID=UPI00064EDD45|nr:polysaccharide biosynthesis C-terminal domain-containing protein [Methanobacterium paludis]
MNAYKIFVQRLGLMGATSILVALSTLMLIPVLTKSFGAVGYGIWIQVGVTVALLTNIATVGLLPSMIRFLAAEKNKEMIQEGFYSIISVTLLVISIILIILLIFSKPIAVGLFDGNIAIANLMAFIIFFACFNSVFLNYYRTFQQIRKYSLFTLSQTYLAVMFAVYLTLSGHDLFSVLIGLLITYLIFFFVMIYDIITEIGFKIPNFKCLKQYLAFGVPTIPSNMSYWVVESSDRYVISILLGAAFVGYYAPSYTLGTVILLLAPFSLILPSVLPEYYDKQEMDKVRTFINYSLKYFLLLAIPSLFGLSLLSKPILSILTTPTITLNGYLVTPFIILGTLIFGIYQIINNILILEKKTKIIGTIWIIAAVLNLTLNIVMVPHFGILAAAAVTLVSYLFAFAVTLHYSIKYFNFRFKFGFVLKSVVASILMSSIIVLINPEGVLNILIVVGLCAVVYVAAIIILKGINNKEIEFFKELLQRSS